MKKLLFLVASIFMFMPFLFAVENVSIRSIDLDVKEGNAEIVSEPTIDGLNINFNVSFASVDDMVKYRVVVQNDDNEDYKLNNLTDNLSEYVEYKFTFEDDNNIVPKRGEKVVYIEIRYNREVPSELLVGNKYNEEKELQVSLSNAVDNPKTGPKSAILILVWLILISLGVYFLINKQKGLFMIVFGLLVISSPLAVQALRELTIKFNSNVEIDKCRYKIVINDGSFVDGEDVKEVCFNPINDGYSYNDVGFEEVGSYEESTTVLMEYHPNEFLDSSYIKIYEDDSKEHLLAEITKVNVTDHRIVINERDGASVMEYIDSFGYKEIGHYDINNIYVESSGPSYDLFYTSAVINNDVRNKYWVIDRDVLEKVDYYLENHFDVYGFSNCIEENNCSGRTYYPLR